MNNNLLNSKGEMMNKWKIIVACLAVVLVAIAIYTILYFTYGFLPNQ